jgi:alginate O-acetyltransferase complex protein AlgI
VVTAYWLIPARARRWWLLGASLTFYASWNLSYVPGLVGLIVINHAVARRMADRSGAVQRRLLAFIVVVDLAVLGLFKYLDWLLGSTASVFGWLTGRDVELGALGLILPLSISFVTFTLLAYVIDVYRGRSPERRFSNVALFITFFPHLVAGPIVRASELLPQVRHPRPFRSLYFAEAAPLLAAGLLKKAVADQLAPAVGVALEDPARLSSAALLVSLVGYTFQLYLDFGGYTDLALGSARLMGYRLPRNFDWPYRSSSMSQFWGHWHMTLSRWLRDYVFYPLGGSRLGERRTTINIMATMVLCGLWHGAGLTYIVWGALQGAALSVHRWWRRRPSRPIIPVLAAWAITFGFVVLVRIFFVAPDLAAALRYLREMFSFQGGIPPEPLLVAAVAVGIVGQWPFLERLARRAMPPGSTRRWAAIGGAFAVALLLLPTGGPAFIYFDF